MIQRVLNLTAAVAAVAAAVAVVIVAASYGVFAAARVWLTPAASAAVVSGIFAAVAILVALIATGKLRPPRSVKPAPPPPPTPVEQAILLAKQRPIMAAGVGVLAAFIAIRNPALLTTAVSAFMAGKAEQPPKPKK